MTENDPAECFSHHGAWQQIRKELQRNAFSVTAHQKPAKIGSNHEHIEDKTPAEFGWRISDGGGERSRRVLLPSWSNGSMVRKRAPEERVLRYRLSESSQNRIEPRAYRGQNPHRVWLVDLERWRRTSLPSAGVVRAFRKGCRGLHHIDIPSGNAGLRVWSKPH